MECNDGVCKCVGRPLSKEDENGVHCPLSREAKKEEKC